MGKNTAGPCTIGLLGDLGAGKTVFIQGLASEAAGSGRGP
ncbi:hypothetical protein [Desulfosalsimonas sp.]